MTVRLRLTVPTDLPFVCDVEQAPENAPFILPWPEERHREALDDPDILHMIAEKTETGHPVGYVIIAGLASPHHSIELLRITMAVKRHGYGRRVLRQIKEWAFREQKAHRLWLDVKETNGVARALYLSEGFREEGILRDCLKTGDTYESLVVLSMLADEYEA
ncbi:N-acetyltransferase [Brevibacillus agri]|uniref:N-acetyltransferase n=1 Tax=Brevibacillus agri TaxID=51101 RepID=A0A3M8B0G2_9BACL|nr:MULTISPECIES: GNAT family N-acetyltransferase [Brevibacillus]EJL46119.1 acetyltransferase [Brevibacillus sp. CF112]MBG9564926.1 acetyltransferase [Brevibacillus agri]MBY0054001.1 GNAT family N-acetyltransferase [Brevibacillus agri]MCG5251454.1 GNAT family N-acetyltransferase [Brevibacillus agri]MDN4094266.1 GNAT family N-acetyltransferase [Brevibacillus agri]